MPNRQGPSLRGLYAITDDRLLPDERLESAVTAALTGGARLLQYRSKSPDPALRLAQALRLKKLCDRFAVPLIINDDPGLCEASGADGVHLGQADTAVAVARQQLGPQAIIGTSCHESLDLALAAQEAGASYVAFGRFFASRTKPEAPPAGLWVLEQARQRLSIPVVAIGGINPQNGASVITAGAHMVAVIDYLFAADDVESRARQLSNLFRQQSDQQHQQQQ